MNRREGTAKHHYNKDKKQVLIRFENIFQYRIGGKRVACATLEQGASSAAMCTILTREYGIV